MYSVDNPWIADLPGVSSEEISEWLAENKIPGRVIIIPPYRNYGYVVHEGGVQVNLYSSDDALMFKLRWL